MKNTQSHPCIFVCVITLFLLVAGCLGNFQPPSNGQNHATGPKQPPPGGSGPGGCSSSDTCQAYCMNHIEECKLWCQGNPGYCPEIPSSQQGEIGGKSPGAVGTQSPHIADLSKIPPASTASSLACGDTAVTTKMMSVIRKTVVNPPSNVREITWMTKILPSTNPFPGYYYAIGTAFGPATEGTQWAGTGVPSLRQGEQYCSFGYWDSIPKGKGGQMGSESPSGINYGKYDLTIFCTNASGGSQYEVINSLPNLIMTEEQAKTYYYSVIRKDFLTIDNKPMTREGQKIYQMMWNDSAASRDHWVVQIGTGYIGIGQGRVNYEEALLAKKTLGGDPGTMWIFHGCRPCNSCLGWTDEKDFNKDCTADAQCLGGLSCNNGQCVAPEVSVTVPTAITVEPVISPITPVGQEGSPGTISIGGNGPGSACKISSDCASGLSCTSGACSIPGGKP